MSRLAAVRLQVPDPEALVPFYRDALGMRAAEDDGGSWRLGYPGEDADLLLLPGGSHQISNRSDRYWKIGICLPDLDLACQQLRQRGIQVSAPHQFLDIGYMAHLQDPAGFAIELLQHDFEGQEPKGDPDQPLGGGAHIGQITLRTGDIGAELVEHAGMKLLSVQPVPDYGFDLYFLAFTTEEPPNADLQAVENRPWLWRRPYTTLEFQHLPGASISETPAYQGLKITDL
ncbi:Glyoxalase/bleomycin resistance protein/dioxygenase [Roseobacter sp. SK209-2-6]|uniref:VOC family protein n=1 Tax=Roseobacter sp. SK209-2-6 TaxID=388739 RepID=UPI0000F3D096|nr:VOC family protein [Roseobacter sp. SK209-2-6]EBA17186.1 Glyoxalase/bleomycin resistance protein/dioxygenase [Roseobacter sp. SK209-2-6]